jgi:hypothetical protein
MELLLYHGTELFYRAIILDRPLNIQSRVRYANAHPIKFLEQHLLATAFQCVCMWHFPY